MYTKQNDTNGNEVEQMMEYDLTIASMGKEFY